MKGKLIIIQLGFVYVSSMEKCKRGKHFLQGKSGFILITKFKSVLKISVCRYKCSDPV